MLTFKEILEKIADRQHLSESEAAFALTEIVTGHVSDIHTAAFLFGMRSKGETVEEMTTFTKVMRQEAVKVDVDTSGTVDLCGTGGDHSGTFNISTSAMFVVAGAGVPVLKHGNRSVSSKSGSADVLEALGAVAELCKEQVEKVFADTGIAFMYAPFFHPAMKHVMPVRRKLGMRTFFNVLGPLLNPADVRRQIVGAYSREIARLIAQILSKLDTDFAYTVNANDGLDEVSLSASSELFEVSHSMVSDAIRFDPRDLNFELIELKDLKGGDAKFNAEIIENIVDDRSTPAQKNIAIINAAFGIHAAGKAEGLREAKAMAEQSIRSGKARKALDNFVEATNEVYRTSE